MNGEEKENYNSLDDFMESKEFNTYKKELTSFPSSSWIIEDDFNIDDINYLEVINYPISWWIEALDKELGWQPIWKYMMLYGAAWCWKTTLTLQIAISNHSRWNNVCYLSFEMPKRDFIIQNMRSRAWLKQSGVWISVLPTPSQQYKMKEFINSIRGIDIKWYKSQPSMKEFESIMNSLMNDWTPNWGKYHQIIIDNLWMIWRWDGKDEMQLYWEASAFIKNFCDRSWISVIMLHHTNKGSEQWNWKRWFSAFRWNWKLADDCDYVVQLQREYLDLWETQSTIKIEKDRIAWKNWYTLPLSFDNWIFRWDSFM